MWERASARDHRGWKASPTRLVDRQESSVHPLGLRFTAFIASIAWIGFVGFVGFVGFIGFFLINDSTT